MTFKLVLSLLLFQLIHCNEVRVNTTSGNVEGQIITFLNKNISQFLGIPYAEPPVGELRFAKPKPISKPIEGIIDATKVGNSCIQPSIHGSFKEFIGNITTSEDCLVLNIWTANDEENNSTEQLKPVMFWIHGGGLEIGSIFQKQYYGHVLATEDVVVVSANYRLGAFGFLYAENDTIPGNMGFYDQLLALKWVRDNIHLFGGDKNQITIFGESAGSWSVSAHLISPLSKGLFKRAIMQSGAIMFNKDRPIITKEEAINKTKEVAKALKCTDEKTWLHCLRSYDPFTFTPELTGMPMAIFGTEFLPITPYDAFENFKINKDLELLAGVTKDEGSSLAYYKAIDLLNGTVTIDTFKEFIARINPIFHNLHVDKILEHYLEKVNSSDSNAVKWRIYDFYGDLYIKCPTYHFAKYYSLFNSRSNTTKVYFYEFLHQGKGTEYGKEFGVYHGAEIDYVFGLPLLKPDEYQKQDIELSKQVMKYWTNFSKYGSPEANLWPEFINRIDSTSETKVLAPNSGGLLINALRSPCDGFW